MQLQAEMYPFINIINLKENLINYNRNKDLGDKLICYIIVLTLWIYDFQFEPTRLISLF